MFKSILLLLLPCSLIAQSDEVIIEKQIQPAEFNNSWATEWKQNEKNYQPDSSTVALLRKILSSKNSTFRIYLGTWCDDSKQHVPAFMKVADLLNLKAEYIGVNRKKECPFTDCKNWDINYVPTVVVFVDGKEVGRIVETPEVSVEKDLLKILGKTQN